MKNTLKKIAIFLAVVLIIVGCGSIRKSTTVTMGTSMKVYVMEATMGQIDSMIVVDTLPSFDKWAKASYRDFETGKVVTKRAYTKRSCTYVVMGDYAPYKVSKRISE